MLMEEWWFPTWRVGCDDLPASTIFAPPPVLALCIWVSKSLAIPDMLVDRLSGVLDLTSAWAQLVRQHRLKYGHAYPSLSPTPSSLPTPVVGAGPRCTPDASPEDTPETILLELLEKAVEANDADADAWQLRPVGNRA